VHPGARTDVGPPPHFLAPQARLGFGAWAVGGAGWGRAGPEAERIAAVRRAVERGVTVFDTAPSYGAGASEELLGRALRGAPVAIATKVGPADDPRRSLEASLRRLRRDVVDLVELHELGEGWERRLEELHRLQREGKARAIGICNATHLQLARARAIAPVAAYQASYNVFDRDVEQRELPLCRRHGIAFLAYRPLAAGLLTGKFRDPPAFPANDHRRRLYWFRGPEFGRRRAVLACLEALARELGRPLAAVALGWLLAREGVSLVLVGARSAAQVDENFAARALAPEAMATIDAAVAAAFRPPRAGARARALAATWGERERYIVARLDGRRPYEAIAAEWTDRGAAPLVAAQVKVFVDQLAAQGLVE
jgi:aryl-alcohol dehydrogenase-like predicted oxidoreductase